MNHKVETFGGIKNKLVFISHTNNEPEFIDLETAYQELTAEHQPLRERVLLNKVKDLSEQIDNWQQNKKANALNIAPIIVNQLKDNSLQVIDGKSRLLALYKSQANDFSLNVTILDQWSIIETVNLYIDLHQHTKLTKEKLYEDLFWKTNRR